MEREPDPLEPQNEHEVQAAAADGGEKCRQVPGRECADPEELEPEERGLHAPLADDEPGEEGDPDGDQAVDHRVRPPHRRGPVWLDPVRDADEDRGEPEAERQVAPPVDPGALGRAELLETEVGPDRPDDADRHADEEDEPPVDRGEDTADYEADELAGDGRDPADPEGEPALVRRERVREDRLRVREEEGAPDPLDEPHPDQPDRPCRPLERRRGEEERADGEDDEPGVVHPDAAEHVAEPTERHHEHRRHQQVAHEDPEEVAHVPRIERVEVDPSEDRREADDDDRAVDRGHEDAKGRVRERDPLVVRVVTARRCRGGGHVVRRPSSRRPRADRPVPLGKRGRAPTRHARHRGGRSPRASR